MCRLLHDMDVRKKNTAEQSQQAITVYNSSKQLLPFGFAEENNALSTYPL